jgi:predicted MFS family arabinose efflux permease
MQLKPLIAINALSVVGNGCMAVQPVIVGALVDRLGFTESQAGFVAALEMTGVGLGFVVLFWLAHRLPARVMASAGVITIAAANLMACLVHTYAPMLAVQFVVGLGSAMVFSVYLRAGAAQERPEHLFAIVNAVSIAYSGIFMPISPFILAKWQLPGIFMTLAAIAALSGALLSWIPAAAAPTAASPPRVAAKGVAAKASGALLTPQVVMVLLMMLLLYTGHGAVWAFQERIGVGLGMDPKSVSRWLGISMLTWGVIGSMLASWLGMRLGRLWPQVLSLGVSVFAALLLVFGTTPAAFALACGLIALSWFYGLPYQMGLLAHYDPLGRLNLIGCTMTTSGAALGPALAAILVASAGHGPVGVLAGCCYLVGLLLVIPPSLESRRLAVATDA